ncbi:MAG: 2-dehydropantoate 2-reductase N-terminal domain-containing protein, partial [Streptosporangiales bacterium]
MRAAVFGSGSWGTTFAQVLCDAGNDVRLWARRPELADAINRTHENGDYLPGQRLPGSLRATAELAAAAEGAELAVLAVPSQRLRASLADSSSHLPAGAVLLSLIKGVELDSCK